MLAGLTSNWLASILALLAGAGAFLDDIFGEAAVQRLVDSIRAAAERLFDQGLQTGMLVVLLVGLSVLVMIVGMFLSTLITVALFHGFTLSLAGEDLHRAYGLLTRRASSLPRRRIQVLEIEERLLRRLLRLAALRADTAGSPAAEQGMARGGRDVLVPVVPRREVEALLPVIFPDWELAAGPWRRVSRLAIRRGTLKGSILCAGLAAAMLVYQQSWFGLWPLALVPLIYGVNVARYYNLGYMLGDRYYSTRRGWLGRSTRIVPIRNVQAVVVEQTPFDHRLGLASLLVDTAGQAYTGGGPRLTNLPLSEAEWLAQTLAQRAARTQYRW